MPCRIFRIVGQNKYASFLECEPILWCTNFSIAKKKVRRPANNNLYAINMILCISMKLCCVIQSFDILIQQ